MLLRDSKQSILRLLQEFEEDSSSIIVQSRHVQVFNDVKTPNFLETRTETAYTHYNKGAKT